MSGPWAENGWTEETYARMVHISQQRKHKGDTGERWRCGQETNHEPHPWEAAEGTLKCDGRPGWGAWQLPPADTPLRDLKRNGPPFSG